MQIDAHNLLIMVGHIKGTVDEINKKVSTIHDDVGSHGDRITELEKRDAVEDGSKKSYSNLGVGLISIGGLVTSIIAIFR